jgi:1-acyl-sn-glycerol-3-phosphate acyltransferase
MSTTLKLVLALGLLAVLVSIMIVMLIPLMPWRVMRIRLTNKFGVWIGRSVMWISRCPITIEGRKHIQKNLPALFVGNHTSILDAFTSIWICPPSTAGVAKTEVLYYPFYGQVWMLSGHLCINRSNLQRAKASLRKLGEVVRKHGLNVWMWPEGTRSKDGHLLPFKKGFVHLAIQTGLPIAPVVTTGAHRAMEKSSLRVRKVPIHIKFLPTIDTSNWSLETVDKHVAQLRQVFIDALPGDQQPLPA